MLSDSYLDCCLELKMADFNPETWLHMPHQLNMGGALKFDHGSAKGSYQPLRKRENMRSYARFRPLQPLSLSYLGESSSLDDIDVEREMAEIEALSTIAAHRPPPQAPPQAAARLHRVLTAEEEEEMDDDIDRFLDDIRRAAAQPIPVAATVAAPIKAKPKVPNTVLAAQPARGEHGSEVVPCAPYSTLPSLPETLKPIKHLTFRTLPPTGAKVQALAEWFDFLSRGSKVVKMPRWTEASRKAPAPQTPARTLPPAARYTNRPLLPAPKRSIRMASLIRAFEIRAF